MGPSRGAWYPAEGASPQVALGDLVHVLASPWQWCRFG